jgi:hypothetical protein
MRKTRGCMIWILNTHGLTFIELALILAIAASIVMMVIPLFESASQGLTLEDEANNVASEIRKVQQEAITKGREYRIQFLQGTDTILISYIEDNGKEEENRTVHFSKSFDLEGSTFPLDTLSFNLLGKPSREGKIFMRDTANRRIHINIAPETGKITLDKSN